MMRALLFGVWAWGVAVVPLQAAGRVAAPGVPIAPIVFTPQDRILVLAPHPDDEVLTCGGVIQQARAQQLPVRVVFLTYGDNNQWSFTVYRKHPVVMPGAVRAMGLLRYDEAHAADATLGLTAGELSFLGYPDFRTLRIWGEHWQPAPPALSMLTHVTAVPYPNAFRPGAPYQADSILADLTSILRAFRPTRIFLSHPGDHNPDHRALYLFTRVALWDLAGPAPALHPYLTHVARWPQPLGYRPDALLRPPAMFRDQIAWQQLLLTPAQQAGKRAAIRRHRSQYQYSAAYMDAFARPNELFGDFPPVVLRPGPADGRLAIESGHAGAVAAGPEQLTDEERATFTGLEKRHIHWAGSNLVVTIETSRPLAGAVEASASFFGYRADVPFGRMPKLTVHIGELGHRVHDGARALPAEAVTVQRRLRTLTFTVPLALLGEPQRLLTSARTYLGDLPLDWVSWRVLELQP